MTCGADSGLLMLSGADVAVPAMPQLQTISGTVHVAYQMSCMGVLPVTFLNHHYPGQVHQDILCTVVVI